MKQSYLFAIGLGLSAVSASPALAGSGTVDFQFLSYYGPYGFADTGTGSDRANWYYGSLFNGQSDTLSYSDGTSVFSYHQPVLPGAGSVSEYELGGRTFFKDIGTSGPINGPSSMEFVYDSPGAGANLLSFTSSGFSNVARGQAFTLGTLTFTNGQWFGSGNTAADNMPSFFTFQMTTSSPDGNAFNQTTYGVIRMTVNSPINNDLTTLAGMDAEADWITVFDCGTSLSCLSSLIANPNTTDPGIGTFRVYDSFALPAGFTNSGTVDIVGMFNSLDLLELDNPVGGFITQQGTPLPPVEPQQPAVPEPASWAMMIGGFAMLGGMLRRRGTVQLAYSRI